MALFRKPNNATADGYDFLESGYFWRLTVPVGQWRTVALYDTSDVYNVISNNDSVSPRKPPFKDPGGGLPQLYEIFGRAEGSSFLSAHGKPAKGAREENGRQLTYIQIHVVKGDSGAATGDVALSFRTTSLTRSFGDYDWRVEFSLKNASEATSGFIVQKVNFGSDTTYCDGRPTNDSAIWWEAWQVRNGKIFSGTSASRLSLGDQFTSSNTGRTKGKIWHRSETKFMPGYQEPLIWGKFRMAGPLPATTIQPPGWSWVGTLQRWIQVEYDSCRNPPWEGPMHKYP